MTDELFKIILTAIGVIVSSIASWVATAIIKWFNSKMKDKKIAKYATDILNIVTDAAKNIFQTYVESLKKEGKFTQEAQEAAKKKALDIIHSQLTNELKEYIQDNFNDVDSYLENKLEAVLYSLKNQ